MSGARLAYVGYWVMDCGYLPPLGSGRTDTGMGVSVWTWGSFGKRLSAFGTEGCFPLPAISLVFRTCLDMGMGLMEIGLFLL